MVSVPRVLFPALLMLFTSVLGGISSALYAQPGDSAVLALTGARLIDGTGREPLERATVLIREGRIEAAGLAGGVSIPAGARQVDLAGKTILPGFINAHGHLNADRSDRPVRDKLESQLELYADYGVTSVVVLGTGEGDLEEAVRLRREQDSGPLARARLFVAGPSLRDLPTADEARQWVDRYADAGADIVKIHITGGPNDMTPEVYGALIAQAHARGLDVAAHLFYLEDARGLVERGVDVLAHSVRDRNVDADLIAEIKRRDVAYIPTFTRDLARFVYETRPAFFDDPFFRRRIDAFGAEMTMLAEPSRQAQIRNDEGRQADKASLEQGKRNLKALADAGVLIALGTDSGTNQGQWQGYFEHPLQALIAATGGAARAMGLDRELGTVQPGRWADLLVLNGNPAEDIAATRDIDSVWIAGVRLDRVP